MNMKVYKNIKALMGAYEAPVSCLKGKEMDNVPTIRDAYLIVDENGMIADFGAMPDLPEIPDTTKVCDMSGRFIFPAFADSHTHIVYAGSRELEFVDKSKGFPM